MIPFYQELIIVVDFTKKAGDAVLLSPRRTLLICDVETVIIIQLNPHCHHVAFCHGYSID